MKKLEKTLLERMGMGEEPPPRPSPVNEGGSQGILTPGPSPLRSEGSNTGEGTHGIPSPSPSPLHGEGSHAGEGAEKRAAVIPRATYIGPAKQWDLPQTPRYPEHQTVTVSQFHGFDIKPFAVELAKVTLMIAKKMAIDELGLQENALPLDNLDTNIRVADALLSEWPEFDACIGNPPYMGAKRLKQEHKPEYINRVRDTFPDVPGNADYCVYWFNKAHKLMKPGARAGLVGTNTIRQNYSREGGLDVIVANGGTIYEAVSSTPWSGEAAVHIAIACWTKGEAPYTPARLWVDGDTYVDMPGINSSLSLKTDVITAAVLSCNTEPKRVFIGQQTGHEAFILEPEQATEMVRKDASSRPVIYPFLIGRDLTGQPSAKPSRYVIDLNKYDMVEAQQFKQAFKRIQTEVLPFREKKAAEEAEKNKITQSAHAQAKINHHHVNFF